MINELSQFGVYYYPQQVELVSAFGEEMGYPKPTGSEVYFDKAVHILFIDKPVDLDAVKILRFELLTYLRGCDARIHRASEERERLNEISMLSKKLLTKLNALAPSTRGVVASKIGSDVHQNSALAQILNAESILQHPERIQEIMGLLSGAAVWVAALLPDDRGGKVSLSLPAGPKPQLPIERLIERCIQLFVVFRGVGALSKTVPKVEDTGTGAYAFIDALHKYANGNPVGHVPKFRELVEKYRLIES